jgi:predicted secreted hydrolase
MKAFLLFLAATVGMASPPATLPDGFAVPQPGHPFQFPADYGAHPAFRLEWWYLTGQLYAGPRRFGFEATFFRQAGPDHRAQVQLAHMAILDVATGRYRFQERLNRSGLDAACPEGTLDLWQGPWSLRLTDQGPPVRLALAGGVRAEGSFNLRLTAVKPLVIFGRDGISRKGASPSAVSYYLSFPRLRAHGQLRLGGQTFTVSGEAWMDHEISSNQLDAGQVGWDWAGIQLSDGREIMLYRLRRQSGGADPASALTWVDRAGTAREEPFRWAVESTWTSPATGAAYPARVAIVTTDPATGRERTLRLVPLAADQELSGQLGGIPYWEGACRVEDAAGGTVGSAYLELTGYAKDLRL